MKFQSSTIIDLDVGYFDELALKEVSSRTNLIEMDSPSGESHQIDPNLLHTARTIGDASNNSSQTSLDTNLASRFGDEADMIPLVPMGRDANRKSIPNGKGKMK